MAKVPKMRSSTSFKISWEYLGEVDGVDELLEEAEAAVEHVDELFVAFPDEGNDEDEDDDAECSLYSAKTTSV